MVIGSFKLGCVGVHSSQGYLKSNTLSRERGNVLSSPTLPDEKHV